jgi:hypothetical protein
MYHFDEKSKVRFPNFLISKADVNVCYTEFDKEAMENTSAEGLETSRETIRNRFKKVTPNVSKRATKVKRTVPARLEVHTIDSLLSIQFCIKVRLTRRFLICCRFMQTTPAQELAAIFIAKKEKLGSVVGMFSWTEFYTSTLHLRILSLSEQFQF